MNTTILSDGVVTLRPWRAGDARALVEAYASLDVPPTFEPRKAPLTADDAHRFLAGRLAAAGSGETGSFAIVASNGRLLGACSVVLSGPTAGRLGYWVAAPSRGKGYLGRALRLLLPWATTVAGLRRLHIITRPTNAASRHVAESLGFLLVDTSTEIIRGIPRRVVRYEYEPD